MRFLFPQIFWLLIPWSMLPLIWFVLNKRARIKLHQFVSPNLLQKLLTGYSPQRRWWKFICSFLSLFFGIFALARPQIGTHEEVLKTKGLDLVFLLDVSNSMLTADVAPSRLTKAKHEIKNFINHLSGDRVGIIAFAGSAYPAVPLTTDYDFVKQTLDFLDETSVIHQGTDLAKALGVGIQLLERGGVNEDADIAHEEDTTAGQSDRVIIIVSDGESHEGDESKFVKTLKEKGIRVYSIGVGTEKGGAIPLHDEAGFTRGYKKDALGNMIITRLETANLEAIASKTRGKFYQASSNEGEVEEILSSLSALDRTSGVARKVTVYEELFQYPLAFAVLFLLVQIGIREASIAVILLFFISYPKNSFAAESLQEYQNTKKGIELYKDKDYASAIQHFEKAQVNHPDSMVHHLNLGDAFLKAQSPEHAISEFQEITKSKDPNEAARGAYNLGKAFEANQNQELALRTYQQGLDRLAENSKADSEPLIRLKRALEVVEQQKKQGKSSQESQKQAQPQEQKDKDQNQSQHEEKTYHNPKPQFKVEKLTESDASRILRQLQEQEKQTQKRVMRAKTGKPEESKSEKDW